MIAKRIDGDEPALRPRHVIMTHASGAGFSSRLHGRLLQQQRRHREAKATLERALALPEIEPEQADEIRRVLAKA